MSTCVQQGVRAAFSLLMERPLQGKALCSRSQGLCPAAEGKSKGAGVALAAAAVLSPHGSTRTSPGHGALGCSLVHAAGLCWASKARCGDAAGGSSVVRVLWGGGPHPSGGAELGHGSRDWAPNRLLGGEGVQQVLGPLLESKALQWQLLHSRAPKCPAFCQPSLPEPAAFPVQGFTALTAEKVAGPGGAGAQLPPHAAGRPGSESFALPCSGFRRPHQRSSAALPMGQDKRKSKCSSAALSCVRAAQLAPGGSRGGSAMGGGCREEERGRLESSEEGGRCQCHGLR